MSWDINQVFLVGRLTQDPELRYGQSGNAYSTLSLAVGERAKPEGQANEVSYFRIRSFGRQAEICNQYLSKGSQIAVLGRLKQNRWQDQNGQNRSIIEVIANQVQFLGSPSATSNRRGESSMDSNQEGENPFSSTSPSPSQEASNHSGLKEDLSFSEEDDEIPF